jgi:acetyl-CoA carboxylase alpha subunit
MMANTLRASLSEQLRKLSQFPIDQLLERRYQRLMAYGLA